MISAKNGPDELFEHAWSMLIRGKADRKHAFNLAVLCSLSPSSHPRSRTLVLRNVLKNKGELWCYTDRRSQKALSLEAGNTAMSWTFWSPRHKLQVTAHGESAWLPADRTLKIFRSLPKHSRKAYATLAPPGTPTDQPTSGLPDDWEKRKLTETDYALKNFGVMVTTVHSMDVLQLGREGHLRLRADRNGDDWDLNWLIP